MTYIVDLMNKQYNPQHIQEPPRQTLVWPPKPLPLPKLDIKNLNPQLRNSWNKVG